ncbi:MAG TPA: alpha/beta hydrolase [Pseudonocardia sp.]|nr:alpha/beta hydrolase [Pseudonocardia sp.]
MQERGGGGAPISTASEPFPGPAPDVVTVDVGDVSLGARRWRGGPGRPVLLVHGLSSNARLWDGVAARLATAGHPVVALDLRGHGSSAGVPDPDDGRGATLTAAADLASACASLGWPAPVVAGQSWGGNVVLQLAAERPSLVRAIALVDGGWLHLGDRWPTLDAAWEVLAPPVFDGLTAAALRARLRSAHPDWSGAAIEATLGNLREHADGTVTPWLPRERHRAILGSMLAHRPRELYPRVRCRALLIAATPDGMPSGTPPEAVAEALRLLPDGGLVAFPGGDHDLHAQHPDTVAELVGGLT